MMIEAAFPGGLYASKTNFSARGWFGFAVA